MKEETLLKMSLVISLVGLFLLSIFSSRLVVDEESLDKIQGIDDDEYVSVSGIVSSVTQGENSAVVVIMQETKAKVVVFDDLKGLEPGDKVAVRGKIDEYNGAKQILAEEIKIAGKP